MSLGVKIVGSRCMKLSSRRQAEGASEGMPMASRRIGKLIDRNTGLAAAQRRNKSGGLPK